MSRLLERFNNEPNREEIVRSCAGEQSGLLITQVLDHKRYLEVQYLPYFKDVSQTILLVFSTTAGIKGRRWLKVNK